MSDKFDELVESLKKSLRLASELGVARGLSKGKIGEILLAHHLGHTITDGDKGADAEDNDGNKYEYKVSHDNQFNFNFGHARPKGEISELVDKHFADIKGAYCALMHQGELKKIVYCPLETLGPFLKDHLNTVKGKTFSKRFDPIEEFAKLNKSEWVLKSDFHIDSAPKRSAKAKKTEKVKKGAR